MKLKNKPALLLIDLQKGFEDIEYWGGNRNNPEAELNAKILLEFWRRNEFPVYHIKHCSTNENSPLCEGKPGNEFMELTKPISGEIIIKKNVNSAFIGTTLKEQLEKAGTEILIFAGLTTDHCVSTSVRMAGNYGFDCYVAVDATATFDKIGLNNEFFSAELIHRTALASLNYEFASLLFTSELVEED
jgi:nicotinamidase-related amidase